MNPITVQGDITAIEKLSVFNPNALNSVSQCVNCMGVMGRGLALNIRNKFPAVFTEYAKLCKSNELSPSKLLGVVQPVHVNQLTTYCNLFGQLGYGTNKRQVDYEALYRALEYQANIAKKTPNMDFYFPTNMASSLAGGNWLIVKSMITALFMDLPNNVYFVDYSK